VTPSSIEFADDWDFVLLTNHGTEHKAAEQRRQRR